LIPGALGFSPAEELAKANEMEITATDHARSKRSGLGVSSIG
jgi:hypothetical protein